MTSICEGDNCPKRLAAKNITNIEDGYIFWTASGLHGDCPNENGDFFNWREELLDKSYQGNRYRYSSWIGKPNCANHNENIIIGKIIDAFPIHPEKSIDMLVKTKIGSYKVAGKDVTDLMRSRRVTDVSMGTLITYSYCSECGNKASNTSDWCSHLRYYKGKNNPETGRLVYEDNRGIEGIELSVITTGAGADIDAKIHNILR